MSRARRLVALAATLMLPRLLGAQTYPTTDDPRHGLTTGRYDAGQAISNLRLVSASPKPAAFDTARGLTFANSDLTFGTHYVYQGNFSGFTVWDISSPEKPVVVSTVRCATSQGAPSIYGHLLFQTAEGAGNRNDCGSQGVQDPKDHMAGVRIWDVSNPREPKLAKNVQTCKGSHTFTMIPSKTDKNILYLYLSGGGQARPDSEVPELKCKNGTDPADPTNSLYMLDIVKVPLDHPENAKVIPGARIFTGLEPSPPCANFCVPVNPNAAPAGGRGGRAADSSAPPPPPPLPTGPRNCHDVTSYPELNLLFGACNNSGILVDISNPEKPVRLTTIRDTNNFQGRHTAAFSNDGKKLIVTNEWGGGTSPMCQKDNMIEMGGNTIFSVSADKKTLKQHAYFKLPVAQSAQENCVAHNGSPLPVPGRDVYVQGWYQGGISIMDFGNPDYPTEIGYFDRGSIDPPPPIDMPVPPSTPAQGGAGRSRGTTGGSWGAYYWNGHIYSSEIDRGLDILELQPSAQLSGNEIAAAKLVTYPDYKPTTQRKPVWPPAFVVVRSYLDQLTRNVGMSLDRASAISDALDAAEQKTGLARGAALTALAKQVDGDASGATDGERVKTMASEIRRLAAVSK